MSGDQFRSGNEVERSRGQHGHVQRLADVASSFWTTRMMVEQAAARSKIQQNSAGQDRQRSASDSPSEDSPTQSHKALSQPSTLDAGAGGLDAKRCYRPLSVA
jgi:hypothetical protein